MNTLAPSTSAELTKMLIQSLERDCARYCILAGFDELPDNVTSDIDFMVDAEDFRRLPKVMHDLSSLFGAKLVQFTPHEISAGCYILAYSDENGQVRFLNPDSANDYRRHGRLWLKAEKVLGRRRQHAGGFWIPAAADAFAYYCIKRVEKGQLLVQHGRYLSSLFQEDPRGCSSLVAELWPPECAKLIETAAESRDWSEAIDKTQLLRGGLLEKTKLDFKLSTLSTEFSRIVGRLRYPTGIFIVVLGPDGSGKSSVIQGLASVFGPIFRKTRYFHLRPRMLNLQNSSEARPVTDPHGQPSRGWASSIAKVLILFADYIIGYLVMVRPLLTRSSLVIFDRYAHDMTVDPHRFRYGGPKWLLPIVSRLVPKPDLILILDASAEVLQSRKREVAFEESDRQRRAYLALASDRGNIAHAKVINAANPVDMVIGECVRQVLDFMEDRTELRLKLHKSIKF